jgi:hypothetical protein
LLALTGSARQDFLPPSDAFIWQRHWTPALRNAVSASGDFLKHWHVLAAEISRAGQLVPIHPDWPELTAGWHAAVPVIRIEGVVDGQPELPGRIAALAATWPQAVRSAIEIDYDCPTARLPAYAAFLAALRHALPAKTQILATALPTWLASPDFSAVAGQADRLVLQVHAIDDPRLGLFSAARARRWVATIAQRSRRPFLIALPAYGAREAVTADHALLAVSGEAPGSDGAAGAEMTADPAEIAAFIAWLRQDPPDFLQGLVWFRLPTTQDRRAWSLQTLRRVAMGETPRPRIALRLQSGRADGVTDLLVVNDSDADGVLPETVQLPAGCKIADGVGQYRRDGAVLTRRGASLAPGGGALLHARDAVLAGWMRCGAAAGEQHAAK